MEDWRRSGPSRSFPAWSWTQSMGIMCYHEVNLTDIAFALNTFPFPAFRSCISFPLRRATHLIFASRSSLSLPNFIPVALSVRLPQNKCRKVPPEYRNLDDMLIKINIFGPARPRPDPLDPQKSAEALTYTTIWDFCWKSVFLQKSSSEPL